MYNKNQLSLFRVLLLFDGLILASCYYTIELENDGPIVRGAQITFRATLYYNGQLASGSFKYSWEDNAVPGHRKETSSKLPNDLWSVTYNKTVYPLGSYVVQVIVCKYLIVNICPDVASRRAYFFINETLNGDIVLVQVNATKRHNNYVSSSEPVIHNITLKESDFDFIKVAPKIETFWFVDCVYYGFRNDFIFPFNYTKPDTEHFVEALVVADFTPLPPPSPPTTIKPNVTTTVSPVTTSTTPKSTTPAKPASSTAKNEGKALAKREIAEKNDQNSTDLINKIMVEKNGTLVPYNGTFPYICNGTNVATDKNKTYGHFTKKVRVRQPVSNVDIQGNNWLQHGELLTLKVKCEASSNLKYCVNYMRGAHNVTGNETCSSSVRLDTCDFTLQRYFGESIEYTIIIIIENEVSKEVRPVTVTVYKVKQQAQLSVIVVPVVFILVAVVLIVFGVAYYIQNRSRFVVEVADFNFGQNYSDMEYKTFKERLRDSISNAFFSRGPSPGSSEVPVWPPGRKYGSMGS